jgi:hypothetical protein
MACPSSTWCARCPRAANPLRAVVTILAFSPDKKQRFLLTPDVANNHICFLNREDGKVAGTLRSMGQNRGQFFGPHTVAVDSKGNI